MTCATLRELIVFAYPRDDGRGRTEREFAGGPSWMNADRFDVVAKAPEGQGVGIDVGNSSAVAATPAVLSAIGRIRAMAQAMLADRFKLAVHHESRDLPAFDLTMDRSDGRLGPQLKRVDLDCVALRAQQAPTAQGCGGFKQMERGHFVGHAVSMAALAQLLEVPAGRNVFDRTGLQNNFDLEFQWTPDPRPGADAPAPENAVSIFTALREQLGLKLESTKAPVDVLVIDRAEKPTPD